MHTAREYYDLITRPTVEEFLAAHHDARKGMLACVTLLHAVDHVFQNRISDPKKAEAETTKFNDKQSALGKGTDGTGTIGYAAVHAFANASKHARLTREKLNPGFGSKDYDVVPPGFVGELAADLSFIGDEVGGVTIRWDRYHAVNLKEAVKHTMGILEAEFPELTA